MIEPSVAAADHPAVRVERPTDVPLCDWYDLAIVDLDGTVYVGQDAVPEAAHALAQAKSHGMKPAYVTNNASRTPEQIAEQLLGFGVHAEPADVLTSAQAAARLLLDIVPPGSRVLVVGGVGLRAALEAVGLVPVGTVEAGPAAVVQGWAPELDWALLAEGAYALEAQLPWVATNTDRTLPTPRGLAPGNGAFVSLLAGVTGRQPDSVAGKPGTALLDQLAARFDAGNPLVVGDRLDTDIEAAVAAGLDSLLVLTGVTDVLQLLSARPQSRPTFVSEGLSGLLVPHGVVVRDGPAFRYGGSTVTTEAGVDGRTVVVLKATRSPSDRATGEGWIDVVRAAAAAAWAITDTGASWDIDTRLRGVLTQTPGMGSAEERP